MSAPYCTSLPAPPVLGPDGILRWSNGGWACDSGPVEHYISHLYTDDGVNLCGDVPQFRYDGTKPVFGLPGFDVWECSAVGVPRGIGATLDLYAVTHSVYPGVYDWWEVGNHLGADPTQTARVRFTIPAAAPAPVAQPNVPAAVAELTNVAMSGIVRLKTSLAYRKGYSNVVAGTNQALDGVQRALAFLRGENP